MLGQKNWLVVFVSAHSLQLFGSGMSEVQTIPLPVTTINNLEVINRDELYTLITDWVKLRTYTNTNILWLLAPDVYFEQTLTGTEQAQLDSGTLQFLDTVPFEKVLSRIYPTIDGRQIIATNQDLITGLMQAFALHGYSTRVVIPAKLIQVETGLTRDIAHSAAKRLAELSRESLISPSSFTETRPLPLSKLNPITGKPKSSLPLLLGIFAALLATLVFVILLNKY